LRPHIEDFGAIVRKIGTALVEESFHRSREARRYLDRSIGSQFLQEGIAPRCHLAKIRDRIEWATAFTKPAKDGLLNLARDYLRVLAVAVEDTGFGFGMARVTATLAQIPRFGKRFLA
jgi:hypothetical protein